MSICEQLWLYKAGTHILPSVQVAMYHEVRVELILKTFGLDWLDFIVFWILLSSIITNMFLLNYSHPLTSKYQRPNGTHVVHLHPIIPSEPIQRLIKAALY